MTIETNSKIHDRPGRIFAVLIVTMTLAACQLFRHIVHIAWPNVAGLTHPVDCIRIIMMLTGDMTGEAIATGIEALAGGQVDQSPTAGTVAVTATIVGINRATDEGTVMTTVTTDAVGID